MGATYDDPLSSGYGRCVPKVFMELQCIPNDHDDNQPYRKNCPLGSLPSGSTGTVEPALADT